MPEAAPETDPFFAPLANTKPFLKIAFEGFAGSGKTMTAAKVAIGMHRRIESKTPIVIFDTELSSHWLKPLFEENEIDAVVKSSRSLADLKTAMSMCRDGYSEILIIDSISAIWENFLEAYKAKIFREFKRKDLSFADWGIIKPTWKTEFTDHFVRDTYHVLMTGRAGYEYDNELNEKGKREIFRSGIKMKVEGETAYEPDFLVLMERFERVLTEEKEVWREATVIKDRSRTLDGQTFRNPDYSHFAPAIELILTKPDVRSSSPDADAGILIQTEEGRRDWMRKKDILLEKIEAYLVLTWPSQTAEAKQMKIGALHAGFGTTSWTEVTTRRPEELAIGLEKMSEFVRGMVKAKGDAIVAPAQPTPAAQPGKPSPPAGRPEKQPKAGRGKKGAQRGLPCAACAGTIDSHEPSCPEWIPKPGANPYAGDH